MIFKINHTNIFLTVKPKTIKHLGENVGRNIMDLV